MFRIVPGRLFRSTVALSLTTIYCLVCFSDVAVSAGAPNGAEMRAQNGTIWNLTHPCHFPDLKGLNKRLDEDSDHFQKVNHTILVQNCANACRLVYGTGNSDMMGIGVRVVGRGVRINVNEALRP